MLENRMPTLINIIYPEKQHNRIQSIYRIHVFPSFKKINGCGDHCGMDTEQAGDEEEDRTSSYFNHTLGVTHKV